jgi:4-hydroxy-tetrahydrodipicolinate synthase
VAGVSPHYTTSSVFTEALVVRDSKGAKVKLHGIWVAVATPLHPSGEIDVENWIRLAESLSTRGVDGLFFFGSTGEGPALPIAMRIKALAMMISQLRNRISITAGAMPSVTSAAVDEIKAYQEIGVDGIVVTTPYYFRPETDATTLRHFEILNAASSVPLIVYNVPSRTGTSLTVEVIAKIAELSRFIGVKDSSGNLAHVQYLIQRLASRPEFSISDGSEDNWVFSVLAGAHGATLGIANVCAELCVRALKLVREGQLQQAIELNRRIVAIRDTVFCKGSVYGGLKEALALLGFGGRTVALPALEADPNARAAIRQLLREEGFLQD